MYAPHLLPKIRSEALMGAIRGMPCTLRISGLVAGHRCAGRDTTVGCHIGNLGKGTSTKVSDLNVVAGCLHCHDLIDRRDGRWAALMRDHGQTVLMRVITAINETQAMLVRDGIITIQKAEII